MHGVGFPNARKRRARLRSRRPLKEPRGADDSASRGVPLAPSAYSRFRQIDGRHPFREAVPDGYVDYPARRRRDGRVAWFNFDLAREMGLVPRDQPGRLDAELARAVLDTFCLVIVNEWDRAHGLRVSPRDRLPHPFMATRYLQLQHPDRRGISSGDGRSIWNGTVRHRGVTWDVSSCGTGVTRLCPATAIERRFFPTGGDEVSYGCGTAALEEGIGSALMSEVFHRNGVATERVLAVIALPDDLAITVRASRCLLRPSHFFLHLRRGDRARLQGVADLYCARRVDNGEWPELAPGPARWRWLAEAAARDFARAAARFETEYIFCWLDWDGDNVLTDGAILDYGSVRQFGLYHRSYRFEDTDRYSTSLPEQRRKAREIVQKFVQIRDFLCEGRKRPLTAFADDPVMRLFDTEYAAQRDRLLLGRMGFDGPTAERLREGSAAAVARFRRAHAYFERARAARGPVRVADGLSWNAIFCSRDLLRELPGRYLDDPRPLAPADFLALAASSYASRRDRRLTPHRRRMASVFQSAYTALLERAARDAGRSVEAVLRPLAARSARINARWRITGDSIDHATARILRQRPRLAPDELYPLVQAFLDHQDRRPILGRRRPIRAPRSRRLRRLLEGLVEDVAHFREGL